MLTVPATYLGAELALAGDGVHSVSLDEAIEAMRVTAKDMHSSYKETSLSGLAVSRSVETTRDLRCAHWVVLMPLLMTPPQTSVKIPLSSPAC